MSQQKKIGILGGSFDPIHYGHLAVAEQARIQKDLDEIWFLPAYIPPHKTQLSLPKHRLNMLKLATSDNPYFKIEEIEIDQKQTMYTYDTIQLLKNKYPYYDYYFIIGGDMVEYLPKWYQIQKLFEEVTFLAVARYGYRKTTSYPVVWLDIPYLELSATWLRAQVQSGNSIRYYVPDAVYEYIKKEGMYDGHSTSC